MMYIIFNYMLTIAEDAHHIIIINQRFKLPILFTFEKLIEPKRLKPPPVL